MRKKFIIMDSRDNCATALDVIEEGEELIIDNDEFVKIINKKIQFGHKFAITDIAKGERIFKYGEIIGIATQDIIMGEWIHIHNVTSHYLEEFGND